MKKIESDNFETIDTGVTGKEETPIRSGWFINREGRKLLSKLGYEPKEERTQFAAQLLHEYSSVLKEIVKQELLEEMRNRIESIDTFYR